MNIGLSYFFGHWPANGSPLVFGYNLRLDPFCILFLLEPVLKVLWVGLPMSPMLVADQLDGCQEPHVTFHTLVVQLNPVNRPALQR